MITNSVAIQQAVEAQLSWVAYHADQALCLQDRHPVRLSWGMREELRRSIERMQALLDEAEANYRERYGKDAA